MTKKTLTIDIDDFSTMLDGLNNALVLLGDDTYAKMMGCASSEKLKQIPVDEAMNRFNALKCFYLQLVDIEKKN